MRRIYLLIALCWFRAIPGHAQVVYSTDNDSLPLPAQSQEKRFLIKTDALSLLNSAISRNDFRVSLSGAVGFRKYYGFQLDFSFEKSQSGHYRQQGISMGTAITKFICCEDYEGLYAGVYCRFEPSTVEVDLRQQADTYLKYRQWLFACGLCGGYLLLLNNHWTLEPAACAGYSDVFDRKIVEAQNTQPAEKTAGFSVWVALSAGYRF